MAHRDRARHGQSFSERCEFCYSLSNDAERPMIISVVGVPEVHSYQTVIPKDKTRESFSIAGSGFCPKEVIGRY